MKLLWGEVGHLTISQCQNSYLYMLKGKGAVFPKITIGESSIVECSTPQQSFNITLFHTFLCVTFPFFELEAAFGEIGVFQSF